jgi:Ni/Co efflux regulator RcnB
MLAIVTLAASAAAFTPAMAQTVPDSDPSYMPPPAHMRQGPPPGTTWHGPAPQMQQMQQMQMHAPIGDGAQQQRTFLVRRTGPGMGPERRHMDYRHIERGGMVPQRWWGPQVQVRNWRMYGFPQPFAGGRWIRYYDDALLIDGAGRVYDSRPGWDWDRYGERWDDDDGVPVYAGDGDRRGRWDDEDADDYGGGRMMAPGPGVRQRVYVQHGPMGPPPPCASMCGGYGYGYGPVLVTETTVTEAPVVEERTIVTYETVRVPVRHRRRHIVRCGCRPAAPPPPPGGGERG